MGRSENREVVQRSEPCAVLPDSCNRRLTSFGGTILRNRRPSPPEVPAVDCSANCAANAPSGTRRLGPPNRDVDGRFPPDRIVRKPFKAPAQSDPLGGQWIPSDPFGRFLTAQRNLLRKLLRLQA